MMRIYFYSPVHFEQWDYRNSIEQGIGGSETSAVEMAWRLARRGHEVTCYAPVPDDCSGTWRGTIWRPLTAVDPTQPGIWVIYRDATLADQFEPRPDQHLWLMCQDEVARGMTEARAAKFEKILALCRMHAIHLEKNFPYLKEKIVQTSNGVKMDLIREVEAEGLPERNPHRLMYASSPDRGLLPLLKIFTRAREFVPDLELHAFYGFDNIDKLMASNPLYVKHFGTMKANLERAMEQPGVTWHGRVDQHTLYREWLKTGIWCYPTQFSETSPVHGDTVIETLEYGSTAIRELVGKSQFHVYSVNPRDGHLSISTVHNVSCTRYAAPVIRLKLRPGVGRRAKEESILTLTPDHEVMLRDGRYVPAGQLQPKDRVKAFTRCENGWGIGYAMIGVTGQPSVPEHHVVAQWSARRSLEPGEVVDHKDGNTRNNAPDNLYIWATQSDHAKDHWSRMSPEERRDFIRRQSLGIQGFQDSLPPEQLYEMRSKGYRAMWARINTLPPNERQEFINTRAAQVTSEGQESRRRHTKEYQSRRWGTSPWRDRELMYQAYIIEGKSTVDMAKAFGCADVTIGIWLKHHGIQVRNMSESQLNKRRIAENHVVISIEDAGQADVYCMEVEPDHNFIANGIVVHNCITSLEAQALGAIPITNPYWALRENVQHGIFIEGYPSRDPLTQARYVGEIVRLATHPTLQAQIRAQMIWHARCRFNWERYVDQWESWMYGGAESTHWHDQYAFQQKHARGRVLNVGSNIDMPAFAARGGVNLDICAVDPDTKMTNAVHILADARSLPFHEHFDTVILGEILEHLSPADACLVLKQAKAAMAPGGRVVITCPNDGRGTEHPHLEYAHGITAGHERPIAREELEGWIDEAGLTVQTSHVIDYTFFEGHGIVCS